MDLPERIPLEVAMAVKGENRELLKKIAEYSITSAGQRAASYTFYVYLVALLLLDYACSILLSTG